MQATPEEILGTLARRNEFGLLATQKEAWLVQIALLQTQLEGLSGSLFAFIKTLLDCEFQQAQDHFARLMGRFPIVITRNLHSAKAWIRMCARGTECYGLVASSKALRLKPHAIDIRVSIDPVHWFLNGKDDTRSSYYLEDAATEFQVQGLGTGLGMCQLGWRSPVQGRWLVLS